jgi:hypothetical protein
MKCPVCEQFGRELRFDSRRELNQHTSRFHGLTGAQLNRSTRAAEELARPEKPEAMRQRRLLH